MSLFKKQYYLHLIQDIHGRNAQSLLTPNIEQVSYRLRRGSNETVSCWCFWAIQLIHAMCLSFYAGHLHMKQGYSFELTLTHAISTPAIFGQFSFITFFDVQRLSWDWYQKMWNFLVHLSIYMKNLLGAYLNDHEKVTTVEVAFWMFISQEIDSIHENPRIQPNYETWIWINPIVELQKPYPMIWNSNQFPGN